MPWMSKMSDFFGREVWVDEDKMKDFLKISYCSDRVSLHGLHKKSANVLHIDVRMVVLLIRRICVDRDGLAKKIYTVW
jgi:hypothetical protein